MPNEHDNVVKTMKHIAIYGGTFNPIHLGHIKVACDLQEHFKFDKFIFLPNKSPVMDKITTVSPTDRLEMLRLALASYPAFTIDEREINRPTPSFMVETLSSIREDLGNEKMAISLIIGMDSFLQFHRWCDWQKILTLCNLIVLERKGHVKRLPLLLEEAQKKGEINLIENEAQLVNGTSGGYFFYNAGLYDVSSTTVRELLKSGEDASLFLTLPVKNYIERNGLYGANKF